MPRGRRRAAGSELDKLDRAVKALVRAKDSEVEKLIGLAKGLIRKNKELKKIRDQERISFIRHLKKMRDEIEKLTGDPEKSPLTEEDLERDLP